MIVDDTININDMLSNAHNNWQWRRGDTKRITLPRAMLENPRYALLHVRMREQGFTYTAMEDIPHAELREAMLEYKNTTDWSAFKRQDWQAAYDTLS